MKKEKVFLIAFALLAFVFLSGCNNITSSEIEETAMESNIHFCCWGCSTGLSKLRLKANINMTEFDKLKSECDEDCERAITQLWKEVK